MAYLDEHTYHYASCGCTEAQITRLTARIERLKDALCRLPCQRCGQPVGPPIELSDGRVIAVAYCPACATRHIAARCIIGAKE